MRTTVIRSESVILLGELTSNIRLLQGHISDNQEPANADAVVRGRTFKQCLQRREAERLPNELRECRVGTVREGIDDGNKEEEVGLRIFKAEC